MSWDVDKQEVIEAVMKGDHEWLWSALQDAYKQRDDLAAQFRGATQACVRFKDEMKQLEDIIKAQDKDFKRLDKLIKEQSEALEIYSDFHMTVSCSDDECEVCKYEESH